MKDEIVEEVRRIREAYAEKFNFDLAAICNDLRERERTSGREYVTLTPKRFVPTTPNAIPAEPEPDSMMPTPATQES